MSDQANVLRGLMQQCQSAPRIGPAVHGTHRARTIAVTSGKGGVGKSNIALNLAVALAQADCSVCLLDANLGLGNIDLLCGLNGYWNLSHVITGARTLHEVVLSGPAGVKVVPGASGFEGIADCPPSAQREIFGQLDEFEQTQDFIVIDTGTGIHRSVRQFAAAADAVLVVSTPEPTSIADAYATIKTLSVDETPMLFALVNQADSPEQARAIVERLKQTSRLFLKRDVACVGSIPRDGHVAEAVVRRVPFLLAAPQCPASKAVGELARRLRNLTGSGGNRNGFFPRLQNRTVRKAA